MQKFDERFLLRARRATLGIYLFALLISLQWVSLPVSLGLTVGVGLIVSVLTLSQWVIRTAYGGPERRAWIAGVALLVKLPVIGASLWFLLTTGLVHPIALLVGLVLPQATVVTMVIGILWNQQAAASRSKRHPKPGAAPNSTGALLTNQGRTLATNRRSIRAHATEGTR